MVLSLSNSSKKTFLLSQIGCGIFLLWTCLEFSSYPVLLFHILKLNSFSSLLHQLVHFPQACSVASTSSYEHVWRNLKGRQWLRKALGIDGRHTKGKKRPFVLSPTVGGSGRPLPELMRPSHLENSPSGHFGALHLGLLGGADRRVKGEGGCIGRPAVRESVRANKGVSLKGKCLRRENIGEPTILPDRVTWRGKQTSEDPTGWPDLRKDSQQAQKNTGPNQMEGQECGPGVWAGNHLGRIYIRKTRLVPRAQVPLKTHLPR